MPLAGEDANHAPFRVAQQHEETLLSELERETRDPHKIVQHAPSERFMLCYLDTSCLVINRMVGECIPFPPATRLARVGSSYD